MNRKSSDLIALNKELRQLIDIDQDCDELSLIRGSHYFDLLIQHKLYHAAARVSWRMMDPLIQSGNPGQAIKYGKYLIEYHRGYGNDPQKLELISELCHAMIVIDQLKNAIINIKHSNHNPAHDQKKSIYNYVRQLEALTVKIKKAGIILL